MGDDVDNGVADADDIDGSLGHYLFIAWQGNGPRRDKRVPCASKRHRRSNGREI